MSGFCFLHCWRHRAASRILLPSFFGPVSSGAPAFIMLVFWAALYWAIILHQRGLRFAPSLRCAGPRVVRSCLPPVGRAHRYVTHACDLPVLGPAGFSHRVGAPTGPPRSSDSSLCPARCPNPLSGPTPRSLRIIPGDEGGRRAADPPHRGGAMPYSPECVEWAFSEVRLYRILRTSISGVFRSVGHGGTF
jgi:hypothetical protein